MDASKITEMRQKQSNIYLNRSKVMDASTLTWNNMIQASKYVATQAPITNMAGCTTCGGMSQVATGTAGVTPGALTIPGQSTLYVNSPPVKPNPYFNNKGSGSFVYSSESITLSKAGYATCGVATPNQQQYITLPRCFCAADIFYQDGNVNNLIVPPGADVSGSWLNPYLPIPQPYIATAQIVQPNSPCRSCSLYRVNIRGQWVYSASYVAPNVGVVATEKDPSGNVVYVNDCVDCRPRATDVSKLV